MKSKSMNKSFSVLFLLVVIIFLILVLSINVGVTIHLDHINQQQSTVEVFGQLEQLIQSNSNNIKEEKEAFKERCIRAANIAAKFVENDKNIIDNYYELKEIAQTINVDEINIFDENGFVVSSTQPEYIGYSFNSGDQMSFFKPMLSNKGLKMCQDILPNSVNGKEMQYAAVWLADGSAILEIGLEPRRIIEEVENNRLDKIIADLPFKIQGELHVVDRETLSVLASTNKKLLGIKLDEDNLTKHKNSGGVKLFHAYHNNRCYCTYFKASDDYIFVRTYESRELLENIFHSSLIIFIYYVMGSVGVLLVARWYIRNYFTDNLKRIIREVKKIDKGDLNVITLNTRISEFDELLSYINHMLNNIRLNRNKLTYIMDKGGIPIGVFEKNTFYNKTFFNERIMDLFGLLKNDGLTPEERIEKIEERLDETLKNEVNHEEHVYKFIDGENVKFLRVESIVDEQGVVYYITDLTIWWDEFNVVKEQSVVDELTKLYNRRGFQQKMTSYFSKIRTEKSAIIMIDTDNLKRINDYYGHHVGDEYLIAISNSLREVAGKKSLCARLGGDEFIVFLFGFKSLEELERKIENVKQIRGRRFNSNHIDEEIKLQFSSGVALYPRDSKDFHVLMRIADEKMYQDKKKRKNSR